MSTSAQQILDRARAMLDTARLGLADLLGPDPTRSLPGIRNVATFGRSVTFVLQNLRSVEPSFDEWYAPRVAEMQADPLLRYFVQLRNEILKEGGPQHGTSLYIAEFGPEQMALLQANRPPGATSFFMGDQLGGSGWEVALPDGTSEKYYVQLPPEIDVTVRLHFPDPPTEHQGHAINDTSLQNLAQLYIAYLSTLLTDAEQRFGEGSSPDH